MSSSSSQAYRRAHAIASTFQPAAQLLANGTAGHFDSIPIAPPDEIFNTGVRFKADPSPTKINLGVGAYRTDEGKPYVLSVVRKAEERIAADKSLNKEYLDISGEPRFVELANKVLFGEDSPAIREKRLVSAQSLSGTGALRVGAEFIKRFLPAGTAIYVSKPTWGNHNAVFTSAGLVVKPYRYWSEAAQHMRNPKGRNLDLDGMLADIEAAPAGSVILLHACAHNPTGVDPTMEQWKKIAEVCRAKKHLPFFDSAYQGFASGDLERDAAAIRYFVAQGFEMLVAQSFAKNMGTYNERCGTVSVLTASPDQVKAVNSQLKIVIRSSYSNPPAHGARVIATVLSDPQLYSEWKEELKVMSGRIIRMREVLFNALTELKTPGDWTHIKTQIGMFSFTGLTPAQCKALSDKHHVYLLSNGRISMCGINNSNIQYLAKAIDDVVRNIKE